MLVKSCRQSWRLQLPKTFKTNIDGKKRLDIFKRIISSRWAVLVAYLKKTHQNARDTEHWSLYEQNPNTSESNHPWHVCTDAWLQAPKFLHHVTEQRCMRCRWRAKCQLWISNSTSCFLCWIWSIFQRFLTLKHVKTPKSPESGTVLMGLVPLGGLELTSYRQAVHPRNVVISKGKKRLQRAQRHQKKTWIDHRSTHCV